MKRFREDIKNHSFAPVYLLYGPEAYLRRLMKQRLREAIVGDDTMNYTYREGKEATPEEIRDIAETMPFLAEKRLIVWENSGLFKRGGDTLAEYLPSFPPETVLLMAEEEIDKRSRLYKAVEKLGYAAECKKQSEAEREKLVLSALGKAGRKITPAAMELFLDRCGDDLFNLTTELEKLISYTADSGEVREEDVRAITSVTLQNRIFEMLDALTSGKPKEAYALLAELKALREPPMRILFLITQQVNRLLQVRELADDKASADRIAAETGLKPFLVRKYLSQARRFTAEELKERLEKLAAYDKAIKSGELADTLVPELILAEFGGKYD